MSDLPIFGSIDEVPHRVGILGLRDVDVYKDRRAGVAFHYRFPDEEAPPPRDESDILAAIAERIDGPRPEFHLVKGDVFLYDYGLAEVPDELESDDMLAIFHHSFNEIRELAERGEYQHFEVLTMETLTIPLQPDEPRWLWAVMRYRQRMQEGVRSDVDRVSHLALRADGGCFNKVRYTYPAGLPPALAWAGFLLFLFEWKHSVDRVLSGGRAVPPSGDESDEEWMRMLAELKHAPLPHPLGFFDEVLAAARQAEIVAHYFATAGGDAQRKLEPHEIGAAIHHETAHAVFAILEKEMAIALDFGGVGMFVDGRGGLTDEQRGGKTR